MSRKTMYDVNREYIQEWVAKSGRPQTALSLAMGHARGFLAGAIRDQRMSIADLRLFCLMTGADEQEALKVSVPKEEDQETTGHDDTGAIDKLRADVGDLSKMVYTIGTMLTEILKLARTDGEEHARFRTSTTSLMNKIHNQIKYGNS